MNETKYWLDGILWPFISITANDEGITKYWNDGLIDFDLTPGVGTPPTGEFVYPIIMWFC